MITYYEERIQPVIGIYYLLADKTGFAIATLLDKITTNHTYFMREADISNKVLDEAGKGRYSNRGLETLPAKWKLSYVNKLDMDFSVFSDKIRKEVISRKFNPMEAVFLLRKNSMLFSAGM